MINPEGNTHGVLLARATSFVPSMLRCVIITEGQAAILISQTVGGRDFARQGRPPGPCGEAGGRPHEIPAEAVSPSKGLYQTRFVTAA